MLAVSEASQKSGFRQDWVGSVEIFRALICGMI